MQLINNMAQHRAVPMGRYPRKPSRSQHDKALAQISPWHEEQSNLGGFARNIFGGSRQYEQNQQTPTQTPSKRASQRSQVQKHPPSQSTLPSIQFSPEHTKDEVLKPSLVSIAIHEEPRQSRRNGKSGREPKEQPSRVRLLKKLFQNTEKDKEYSSNTIDAIPALKRTQLYGQNALNLDSPPAYPSLPKRSPKVPNPKKKVLSIKDSQLPFLPGLTLTKFRALNAKDDLTVGCRPKEAVVKEQAASSGREGEHRQRSVLLEERGQGKMSM